MLEKWGNETLVLKTEDGMLAGFAAWEEGREAEIRGVSSSASVSFHANIRSASPQPNGLEQLTVGNLCTPKA